MRIFHGLREWPENVTGKAMTQKGTRGTGRRGFSRSNGPPTKFAHWRGLMGYTYEQAGDELELSRAQIAQYESGVSRRTGKPIGPDRARRILMRMLIEGQPIPEPWPLKGPPEITKV